MHYSLNFEVNSLKSGSEGSEMATELPEPSVASRLKQVVTKALQEEASLPIDLDTLRFDPGRRTFLSEEPVKSSPCSVPPAGNV